MIKNQNDVNKMSLSSEADLEIPKALLPGCHTLFASVHLTFPVGKDKEGLKGRLLDLTFYLSNFNFLSANFLL